jgi:hypothetical protein
MGQLPSVSTYTLLTLGFPLKDEPQKKYIVSTLEMAANQIVEAYPWLAGQVVIEKPMEEKLTRSGTTKIAEYEPHAGKSKFVHVMDCESLCPSFEDIMKARGPPSMLDGTVICPAYGFANFYPEDVVKPVTIVQANFIKGGLLLTICTHHNVMDANGNEQFIRQFASLCRGEKLSEEKIRIGNSDQNTIVPPLKPGQEIDPLERYRCPSSLGATISWPPPPGHLWKCFRFSKFSVAALKTEASRLCSSNSDVSYISSNDAVTAFIWTRLMAARSAWLPKDSSTTLIRAVNGRRRLETPIPASYMGHSILCCNTTIPLQAAIEGSLSSAAIKLRRTLLEVNDHQVRSFFHLMQTEKDKTTIAYGAKMNPITDIMITSFTAQKLYETSFGEVLGLPEIIRRPMLPDATGLFYLMPMSRKGDIDLIAGVTEDDFKEIMKDAKWLKYTEFIG